ncbi:unnamed protein product [Calypogeia fissa]
MLSQFIYAGSSSISAARHQVGIGGEGIVFFCTCALPFLKGLEPPLRDWNLNAWKSKLTGICGNWNFSATRIDANVRLLLDR